MDIENVISYVVNNGLAIVLIFYYLKNNNQTIKELVKINTDVVISVSRLCEYVKGKEVSE